MKKNNPVFGVLFAVVVAAIFLAVSFPKDNQAAKTLNKVNAVSNYQMY
jgi:hypothetical protein